MPRFDRIAFAKPFLFASCLIPLSYLLWDTLQGALGTDPVAQLEHRSGAWALRLLLITLAITPLRRLTGWYALIRLRRMLGLFAFFYASIHLSIYLFIDLGGFWSEIFAQIVKKPYITVGFIAWLVMLPLAFTSTKGMMRRLGKYWQHLHRLVYLAGLCGVLHFMWLVKSGQKIAVREPLIYLGIFALLMAIRIPEWMNRRNKP